MRLAQRVVTEMGAVMNCRFAFYASVCEVTKPGNGGLVSLKSLDLGRTPYVLYVFKYIDLVSLDGAQGSPATKSIYLHIFHIVFAGLVVTMPLVTTLHLPDCICRPSSYHALSYHVAFARLYLQAF